MLRNILPHWYGEPLNLHKFISYPSEHMYFRAHTSYRNLQWLPTSCSTSWLKWCHQYSKSNCCSTDCPDGLDLFGLYHIRGWESLMEVRFLIRDGEECFGCLYGHTPWTKDGADAVWQWHRSWHCSCSWGDCVTGFVVVHCHLLEPIWYRQWDRRMKWPFRSLRTVLIFCPGCIIVFGFPSWHPPWPSLLG